MHPARGIRVLVIVSLTLLLILGTVALLGTAARRHSVTPPAIGSAAPMHIARADFHSETQFDGKDLELNVAISQIGDDCQAPLKGGICLRYSVVLDEQPIMAGYGVIPMSDVHVTASSIQVTVDTRRLSNFVYVAGAGGPISISWKTARPVAGAQINKPQKATAQGSVAAYALPSSGAIATMIYR
ncbi:MAG: hypothetical protein C5B60_12130 [Chloroflexi bacterium]|nr:MAG: hypothetical protein C5B60_12130 [Chloroflexota bacterium]